MIFKPSDFDGHLPNQLNILADAFRYALVTERTRPGEAAERLLMKVAAGSSIEDAAKALLGVDDACLVYKNSATGARLIAGAANDSTAAAKLRACIGEDAPRYVVETILTGVPRPFICRDVEDDSSRGIALDDWPAALAVGPRYGLVTAAEAADVVCGAIVMLRSRAGCRPYSDFDIDVFRLVGLQMFSRLRV